MDLLNHDASESQYQRKLKELSDFKTNDVLDLANLKEDQANEVCLEVIPDFINGITVLANEECINMRDYGILEDIVQLLHGLYIHFFETERNPIEKKIQEMQANMFNSLRDGYTKLGYDTSILLDDGCLLVTNRNKWKNYFPYLLVGKEEIELKIKSPNSNQTSQ